ncbi:DNA-binding winged helix-turn-helix (wHTH) protein [Fulvimonas soli]|uniref:DNA-binding winged helix-turn-helix (WHTH) protein n=2 Tax=Fulvimonas soli TaxID=155197 RepID=A0A316IGY7_9GAMM|nr:DNA-binding winged helix-turn-helix (wHTH) protein [Fulvimonas soli]
MAGPPATGTMNPHRYRLLDLEIDPARQRVTRDGRPLDVQGLSFRLLACLLRHGDEVLDFDRLIAEVWAPAVVGEETVTQRVKLLRQALGDDGRQSRYIRSVRGRGYQLCAPPQVLQAPAAPAPRRAHRSWRLAAAAAGLIAVAIAVGGLLLRPAPARRPDPPAPATTQELLQRAAYYAGIGQRENNERAIGLYRQALAVSPADAVALAGLGRAYGARVCLYNFPYEWATRAQALAEAAIRADPRRAAAWSALAYAHDCRGEIGPAVAAYEHALALDPSDDASRASAAYLYQEQGRLAEALRANLDMRGDPARVRFREVQIARELELLGFTDAAERRYRASFQLYPDNVFSNIAWPRHLFLQGRFKEAQEALDQALARGTPHVDLYVLGGELALLRGDREAARRAFEQARQLRPQMSLPTTLAALYGTTAAAPDWLDERIARMRRQLADGAGEPGDHLELALLQEARGRRADALRSVATAVQAGYSDRAYLQASPLLRGLAGEPAYAASIDALSRRVAAQRAQVLAADWRPADLREAR